MRKPWSTIITNDNEEGDVGRGSEVAGVLSVLAGPPRYDGGRPMRAMEATTSHLTEGGEENCVRS